MAYQSVHEPVVYFIKICSKQNVVSNAPIYRRQPLLSIYTCSRFRTIVKRVDG